MMDLFNLEQRGVTTVLWATFLPREEFNPKKAAFEFCNVQIILF